MRRVLPACTVQLQPCTARALQTADPLKNSDARRVPLALRGAQQRITPDVQIGCVSCASGDGRFGGPVWWNTPLGDEEAAPEEHRAQWAQPVRAMIPGLGGRVSGFGGPGL